jgi:hypothetical protein
MGRKRWFDDGVLVKHVPRVPRFWSKDLLFGTKLR